MRLRTVIAALLVLGAYLALLIGLLLDPHAH